MAHPRFMLARSFKKIRHTAGDITLNVASVTALDASALDITLDAKVGDVIEYGISARVTAVAQAVAFDVYTVVSAARVNPFGVGISAALATTIGVPGWFVSTTNAILPVTGLVLYTIQSGDLDANGRVLMRPHYGKINTTARVLSANTSSPLDVWAKNLGPPEPN